MPRRGAAVGECTKKGPAMEADPFDRVGARGLPRILDDQSGTQMALQPSPEMLSPSSQSSPTSGCWMPSPQYSSVQLLQPSPAVVLPSSHSSAWLAQPTPLPQPEAVSVQLESQPSQLLKLPSSHCSGACTTPSPQWAMPT